MKFVEIQDKVNDLVAAQDAAIAEDRVDDARELAGEIKAYRAQMQEAALDIERENRELSDRLKAHATEAAHRTIGDYLFGDRANFAGIEDGFRASIPLDAITGIETPARTDTTLPEAAFAPAGILGTIPHGTTDADEKYYQQPKFTNAADAWTTGDKPESAAEWTLANAPIETVAHWMPISKLSANRYSTLESTVANSLLRGLDYKNDAHVVSGKNNTGIVGLTNQTGIQTYTKASGENIYDAIITMKRMVRIGSGFAPTHVALSPVALETIAKTKDGDGRYLFSEIVDNGTFAGLRVVEDANLEATTDSTTTQGAIVYYNGGAQWNVADPSEVTIGLTGNQFIQNAYTLLAENSAALKVPYPAAFAYCASIA